MVEQKHALKLEPVTSFAVEQANPDDEVINALGETVRRSDLHADPFVIKELEEEHAKVNSDRESRSQMQRYTRETMRKTITEQTKNRIKATLGASATDEAVKYCCEPMLMMLEQQNKLVEESRNEIENLQRIMEIKALDIAKLAAENEKFLEINRTDKSWQAYEQLLAKERVVNRRLMAMFATMSREELVREGRKNTYSDWLEDKARDGNSGQHAPFFPRRKRSPGY